MNNNLLKILRTNLILDSSASLKTISFVDELLTRREDEKSEIRDFFIFFADCLDVGFETLLVSSKSEAPEKFGLPGLLEAAEGLRDVLTSACAVSEASDFKVIELFENFDKFVRALPSHSKVETFSLTPTKQANPMIFFLAKNRKTLQIVNDSAGNNIWKKLCFVGYRAMRISLLSSFETQFDANGEQVGNPKIDSQVMGSTRAVFLALWYLDPEKYKDEKYPLKILRADVRMAIKSASQSGKERFKASAETYIVWAQSFLAGSYFRRGRRASSSGKPEGGQPRKKSDDELIICRLPVEKEALTAETGNKTELHWKKIRDEQVRQGASKYEFEPPPTRADTRAAREGLAADSRRTQPIGHKSVWDGTVLTQEIIGLILAALLNNQDIEQLAPERLALLSFVLCQTTYGFPANLLIEAKINSESPVSGVNYKNGSFIVKPRGHDNDPVFARTPDNNGSQYLQSANSFSISAPPFLRNALERLTAIPGKRAHLFDFAGMDNAPALEFFDRLLIKTIGERNLPASVLRQVNCSRIGTSAALHLERYGDIDPLLAAFVRGFVSREFAAQAHYVCLLVFALRAAHRRALATTIDRLMEKSRKTIGKFGLSMPDISQFLENSPLAENIHPDGEYLGSPYVMEASAAADFLHKLHNLIETTRDVFECHNYLTVFTAVMLMHLTSMRPIEVERLVERQIAFFQEAEGSAAEMDVTGKANLIYDEWRYLYLPAPFGKLLTNYRQSAKNIICSMIRSGAYESDIISERNHSFLFFCENRKSVQPLTSELLYKCLCKNHPHTHFLPEYPWETNSPRHFFSTTAFNLGIQRPVIDALMGHSSRGREPLNRNSFLSAGEIRNAANAVARKLTADLQLQFLLNK